MTKKYICHGCSEPCILEFEDDGGEPYACPFNEIKKPEWELLKEDKKMIKIECDLFRPSGKWYTSESVSIPEDTPDWNIPNVVRDNRRIVVLIYVGKMRNGVPFLIQANEEV